MLRRFVAAICICTFVISFDRWGQKAFISSFFSIFGPKEVSRIKTKFENDFPEDFLIGVSSSSYQV
jgi:hypothetical protein